MMDAVASVGSAAGARCVLPGSASASLIVLARSAVLTGAAVSVGYAPPTSRRVRLDGATKSVSLSVMRESVAQMVVAVYVARVL